MRTMHRKTDSRGTVYDFAPAVDTFRGDVLAGLSEPQKILPCKYFYDERGSQLFEQICELDEYYPTRTELAIMQEHAGAISAALGTGCLIIEFGSGTSLKTKVLLDHLRRPIACVLIDIAREHLEQSAARLAERFPHLQVLPVCADFTEPFELPDPDEAPSHRVVYFPGSTVGNFHHDATRAFLRRIAAQLGPGGGLLIGVDLKKDRDVLERAYNDAAGVTAEFNLNLLHRINRELGADFDLEKFHHHACYNDAQGRIEMHLVSTEDQTVRIAGTQLDFPAGEHIRTECSYKYTIDQFAALAAPAGFLLQQAWTDPRQWFAVLYLELPQAV